MKCNFTITLFCTNDITTLAVFEVLATANKNRSQITCYAANDDWLFITVYITMLMNGKTSKA